MKHLSPKDGRGGKTAVIVGPVHPFRGGISLFLGHVAEALSTDEFSVKAVSFVRLYPKLLFPGRTEFDESETKLKEIKDAEFILDSRNPLTWIRAARFISEMKPKPDVLLFSWWNPFFAFIFYTVARYVKRKTGCRVVYFCENLVSHEDRFIDKILTRIGVSPADNVIVLSGEVDRAFRKFFPDTPVARASLPVYDCFQGASGIDKNKARKKLSLDVDERVILFFGYVRKYKGLRYLLEAMPLVTDKLSDVKLLIVGEFYEPRKIYDDIIRKLKIGNSVKITDRYVDNEEVEVYFKAADLVVLPYLSATQSGITQIAKAFGKPVVSTDVGGLSEVVEDGVNGYLVPPGNSLALADKIVESFRRNLFVSRWEKITYKQNESVPGKRIATLVDAAMRGDPDGLFSHGKVESND